LFKFKNLSYCISNFDHIDELNCVVKCYSHYLNSPGIARDHPESYHSFMWNHLFKHIDIDPKNAHILDGNAADLVKECDDFEQLIKDAGGIELFIGGTLHYITLHYITLHYITIHYITLHYIILHLLEVI